MVRINGYCKIGYLLLIGLKCIAWQRDINMIMIVVEYTTPLVVTIPIFSLPSSTTVRQTPPVNNLPDHHMN